MATLRVAAATAVVDQKKKKKTKKPQKQKKTALDHWTLGKLWLIHFPEGIVFLFFSLDKCLFGKFFRFNLLMEK